MEPMVYTTSEAATLLKIGKTRLYQLLDTGRLPARRLGGKLLILHSDLMNYVESLPPRTSATLIAPTAEQSNG